MGFGGCNLGCVMLRTQVALCESTQEFSYDFCLDTKKQLMY